MQLSTLSRCFAAGLALALFCATPMLHAQEAEPPPAGQDAQPQTEPAEPAAAERPMGPQGDFQADTAVGDAKAVTAAAEGGEAFGELLFHRAVKGPIAAVEHLHHQFALFITKNRPLHKGLLPQRLPSFYRQRTCHFTSFSSLF